MDYQLKKTLSADERFVHQIFVIELKELDFGECYYLNKKGKKVEISPSKFYKSKVYTKDFYTGTVAYILEKPEGAQFIELNYRLKSKEHKLFSNIFLVPGIEVHVKKSADFSVLINWADTINNTLPFTINETDQEYHFTTAKQDIDKVKPLIIRTLLVNKGHDGSIENFFGNWYFELANANNFLEPWLQELTDSLTQGLQNEHDITRVLFNYVKRKIKYIDISDGYGAFQPRNPNYILNQKAGDCKDMSNLLHKMLQHKGVESYLAVSATTSHFVDFDWPTLSSGNHLICVAKIEDEYIFLDPTESSCIYPYPSIQTLYRKVFLVGENFTQYLTVEPPTLSKTKLNSTIDLANNTVNFTLHFNEIESSLWNFFHDFHMASSKKKFEKSLSKLFFGNAPIQVNQLSISPDSVILVAGSYELPKYLTTGYSDKLYLTLSFVPDVLQYENEKAGVTHYHIPNSYEINYEFIGLENKQLKQEISLEVQENDLHYTVKSANTAYGAELKISMQVNTTNYTCAQVNNTLSVIKSEHSSKIQKNAFIFN